MYKKNIIIFIVLSILWIGLSSYFSSTIAKKEKLFLEEKKLIMTFNDLESSYSKSALEKNKKKILGFLDAFDIKYTSSNTNTLNMKLKKTNANKIISYILNSKILFKDLKIEKIDDYTLLFSIKF